MILHPGPVLVSACAALLAAPVMAIMYLKLREAFVTKTQLAGLRQELAFAAQVQLGILPRNVAIDPRVEMFCHITPAREVGGDFYDYFQLDANHVGFVLADVSGKGVPAALFMAITRTLLKLTAMSERSAATCIGRLNDLLAAENEQMIFVTLVYGVINLATGQVDYVNAGHMAPYVLPGKGGLSPVPATGGMAIALRQGLAYRAHRFRMEPGDTLYLYTDGIIEAFDNQGREYGGDRLRRVLAAGPSHESPASLSRRVLDDLRMFENGAPRADDIASMALRYKGPSSGLPRTPLAYMVR